MGKSISVLFREVSSVLSCFVFCRRESFICILYVGSFLNNFERNFGGFMSADKSDSVFFAQEEEMR